MLPFEAKILGQAENNLQTQDPFFHAIRSSLVFQKLKIHPQEIISWVKVSVHKQFA